MPENLLSPFRNSTTDDKSKKQFLSLELPPSLSVHQRSPSPPSLCTPPRSPNFFHSHSNALSPIQPLSRQLALPFLSQQFSRRYNCSGHTSDIRAVDDAVGKSSSDAVVRRPEMESTPVTSNLKPQSPRSTGSISSPKRRWCPLHGHMYCPSISPACATNLPFLFPCRSSTSALANKHLPLLESSTSVQRHVEIWLYSPHHGWYGRGRIRLPFVPYGGIEIDPPLAPRPKPTLANSTTFYIQADSILWAAITVAQFRTLKKRKTLSGLGVVPLSESNGVGAVIKRDQWIPVVLDRNLIHFGIIVSDLAPARHRPHRKSHATTKPVPSPTKPPLPPVTSPIPDKDPKNHTECSIRPITPAIQDRRISTLSHELPPTPTSPLSAGKFQTTESPLRTFFFIFCTLAVSANILAFLTGRIADTIVPSGNFEESPDGISGISKSTFPLTHIHHKSTPVLSAFSPLHRHTGRHQDDNLPMILETPPCTTDTSLYATLWIIVIVTFLLLVLLLAVFATGFVYRRFTDRERENSWHRRISNLSGKALLQRPEWYLKRLGRESNINLGKTESDKKAERSDGPFDATRTRDSGKISGTTEDYGCASPTDPSILPIPVPISKDRYIDTPSVIVAINDRKTPVIPTVNAATDDHDTTVVEPKSEQCSDPDDWEFALVYAARPRSWDGKSTRLCTRR